MWRTIVNGSTTIYSSSLNMHEGDITTDEDWVWLSMATSPPRHTPSLDVVKIRDTGCLGLQDKMQRGWQGNNNASREAALEAQLGDIYTRAGRCVRAHTILLSFNCSQTHRNVVSLIVRAVPMAFYVRTAVASTKSYCVRYRHCTVRLDLSKL